MLDTARSSSNPPNVKQLTEAQRSTTKPQPSAAASRSPASKPSSAAKPAPTPSATFNQKTNSYTFSTSLLKLQVDISPATVGQNAIHLYAVKPDGSGPQTVVEAGGVAAYRTRRVRNPLIRRLGRHGVRPGTSWEK